MEISIVAQFKKLVVNSVNLYLQDYPYPSIRHINGFRVFLGFGFRDRSSPQKNRYMSNNGLKKISTNISSDSQMS